MEITKDVDDSLMESVAAERMQKSEESEGQHQTKSDTASGKALSKDDKESEVLL